jgi:hypothetical protein
LFSIITQEEFLDVSLHYPPALGCLPALFVPSGLGKVSFLHGDVSFALVICPSHLSLPNLTVFQQRHFTVIQEIYYGFHDHSFIVVVERVEGDKMICCEVYIWMK